MNLVLKHIGCNFTRDLSETDLAKLSRQSVSTFSRSFRKHTGSPSSNTSIRCGSNSPASISVRTT